MRYLRIETRRSSENASGLQRAASSVLGAIMPRANPDTERLIESVRVWWLEVEDTGEPNREIGFSESGEPIVIGPIGRNVGYLVDATDDWSASTDDSPEAAADFDATWSRVHRRFAHLEPGA